MRVWPSDDACKHRPYNLADNFNPRGADMDANTLVNPPTTACIVRPGMTVSSPADRFVKAMDRATGFDRLVLATRAIRHDPGCIDARLVLAEHSEDMQTRLRHLETAVAAGEWLWNPIAEQSDSDLSWWGDLDTRPYMRSIHALGLAFQDANEPLEARACFQRLLAMNPHDNQGIRYLLDDMGDDQVSGPRLR